MGGVGFQGTEVCVSSSPAVLVVRVASFLCSVLAWLWCGCVSVGSGSRGLVGVFVPILSCVVVADWRFVCPGPLRINRLLRASPARLWFRVRVDPPWTQEDSLGLNHSCVGGD